MLRQFITDVREGKAAPRRMLVLHAGSVSEELGYIDELSRAAREYDWFEYVPTIYRHWLDPEWTGERGRAEDVARKYSTPPDSPAPIPPPISAAIRK